MNFLDENDLAVRLDRGHVLFTFYRNCLASGVSSNWVKSQIVGENPCGIFDLSQSKTPMTPEEIEGLIERLNLGAE